MPANNPTIISANASDCLSTKQLSIVVKTPSTYQVVVTTYTHASNEINAEALSINNTELLT
jgi:hypothetical protein